jgi:hypothetical protein
VRTPNTLGFAVLLLFAPAFATTASAGSVELHTKMAKAILRPVQKMGTWPSLLDARHISRYSAESPLGKATIDSALGDALTTAMRLTKETSAGTVLGSLLSDSQNKLFVPSEYQAEIYATYDTLIHLRVLPQKCRTTAGEDTLASLDLDAIRVAVVILAKDLGSYEPASEVQAADTASLGPHHVIWSTRPVDLSLRLAVNECAVRRAASGLVGRHLDDRLAQSVVLIRVILASLWEVEHILREWGFGDAAMLTPLPPDPWDFIVVTKDARK